ncbi:repressor LexA [Weissella uvarum]|uniref:transcriptional repressor LexA n=1 Tax=Weissella uvarum TaxID=1479233 RepID=UPI00195FF1BF|nr:transcriptional repressor LexA [Weissella uvarum]MBM7617102.1 repressor LexA [Weissella uvarum]MCM0595398.1 repressor LexA [Weissella uvarum]
MASKQNAILRFIYEQQQNQGYAPTIREIGEHVGLSSSATVHGYINRLIKKGYLTRQQTKSRALKLTSRGIAAINTANPVNYVPVLAENSDIDEPNADELDFLPFPEQLITDHNDLFMIHQSNETMINIGIYPDDVLIVHRQTQANNGDIIVTDLPDASKQVYRFFHEADHYRLEPENAQMKPVVLGEVHILGKVVSLFRSHIQ